MPAIFRSALRPATALAGVLLLAMVASATPAAAAPPPYFTFQVTLGESFISGTGPNNDNVVLVLRDRDGFVKDRVKATTDGSGFLSLERGFNAFVEIGDSIRATDGVSAHTRTFVVPRLGATINRATNVVSGKGPANKSVDLSACVATAYDACNNVGPFTTPVDASGNWSYNFSPINLRGGDDVDIVWSNAVNDSVRRELTTPFMALGLGSNSFLGVAARGTLVNMTLRDKTGKLKSKAQATASSLFGTSVIFFGDWRDQGYPVNVRVGDKIGGSFAPDGQMTVPNLTTNPMPGTDRISGHCFNSAYFEVSARHSDGSDSAYFDGKTGANGNFNIDITADYPTYDLKTDDVVALVCKDNRGDSIGNSIFGILMTTRAARAALAMEHLAGGSRSTR
jgi:hypothetical protein